MPLDPCIGRYDNVCVAPRVDGVRSSSSLFVVYFDDNSKCDGKACEEGFNLTLRFKADASRFPIRQLIRRHSVRHSESGADAVALVPSLPLGIGLGDNMAHALYDSLFLEAAIYLRDTVNVVLGISMNESRPHDVVHAIRRRLFQNAQFMSPSREGCYSRVWAYAWSCDRSLRTYGPEGFYARVQLLRSVVDSLVPAAEAAQPSAIFYAREDTSRRRLHNASAHFAQLAPAYSKLGFTPVYWDDVWGGSNGTSRRPSVEAQLSMVRNAARIISPHGAFPSVMSFFLRPDSIVYELTAACYFYTWLPTAYMQMPPLRLRHVYLSWWLSDDARKRNLSRSLELVSPLNGEVVAPWTSPWCCCRRKYHIAPGGDLDLQVPTDQLLQAVQRWEQSQGTGIEALRIRRKVRRFGGSEY